MPALAIGCGGGGGAAASTPLTYLVDNSTPAVVSVFEIDPIPDSWKSGDATITAVYSGATSLGSYAFYHCSAITIVSLPAATDIGYGAFNTCDQLTSISLPEVITVGSYAFYYCSGLTEVSLPNAVTLGTDVFEECSSLTSISLPLVTTIGEWSFYGVALTSLLLPSATSIGSNCFKNAASLANVYLVAPFAGIASDAFTGSGLTTIHLRPSPNTPAGWTIAAGQDILGATGVTVTDDWTTWPN